MSQIPPQDAWQPHPDPQAPYGSSYPDATGPYGTPAVPSPPTYGQPTSGLPVYGQPASAPPTYGQPAYGQPAYGQPAYGPPAYGPPYGAASPWAVPPPRKRRTGVIVLAAVIGLVVLCGGLVAVGYAVSSGKSGTPHAANSPTADPSYEFTADPTPAIPNGDGHALKAHLLPIPAGAETLRVTGSTDGVFSLDQFVTKLFNGSATARSILASDGYEVAAEEHWVAKHVETHLQLIQFKDDSGAFMYGLSQQTAFSRDTKYTVTDLAAVPNGHMYELKGLDSARNHKAILMAQVGPIFIVVFFFSPNALDHAAEQALVNRQAAALAA